ncbi:hypothetical protein [Roseibium sp. Sym1]|uniref:hypothetical protein n=1 Tax=Roseibium sp. Sym1 TaxID=3016006 RepID=UPI0022B2ED35|nr:hypothetical protein [Roseibium sp. Sym1]
MATEFAISRFLVPFLADTDWALFMDCDMLVRANLRELFDQADSDKAVMVVKHDHQPTSATKMDGQIQTSYQKKNWSSVILFNCKHPSNNVLTPEFVNTQRGLHLHQFCWLKDEEIGELGQEWNWLAGHSGDNIDPKICHHTDGVPFMPGYEDAPYADEWREVLTRWAS